MAEFISILTVVLPSVITGISGYFIAKYNVKSLWEQKMAEKDLEKKMQEEAYEEKLESLKFRYEQELKIRELEHNQSLEKLEAEAKIKSSSAEEEQILKFASQFIGGVMNSDDGMMRLLNAASALENGAGDTELIKSLFPNDQSNVQNKNPNNGRQHNPNTRRKNQKRRK